jgi:DNA-directed RNA polymerase
MRIIDATAKAVTQTATEVLDVPTVPAVNRPVVSPSFEDELDEVMKRQLELENFAVDWGVERFNRNLTRSRQQDEETKVGAAKKLMQMALDPVIAAIGQFVYAQTEGRKATGQGGARHCSIRFIEMCGHRQIAFLTMKVVLDSITKTVQLRTTAQELTQYILDELKFRRFKEKAPGLFRYKMAQFTTSNYAHMARSMGAAVNYHNGNAEAEADKVDCSDLEVPDTQRLLIGVRLIDIAMLATGLFTIPKRTLVEGKGSVRTIYELVATEETLKWLSDRNGALEALWPVNLPMVVPPLKWGPNRKGGYRFNLRGKHALVRGASRVHAERLSQTEMPKVYSALNRIQDTPWVINRKVVALLDQLHTMKRMARELDQDFETCGGIAGVPYTENIPDVKKPEDIETNEPARKAWRKKQGAVKEFNHQRALDAIAFSRFMQVTKRFVEEQAIWFPHNIDFRGRVYPVTNFLSPQGDDMSKGVLKFAQGKPLGKNGAKWLALHGANCLGMTPDKVKLSKRSMDERVQWIQDHNQDILNAAEDPLVYRWWAGADDPLQFIAFCFEWAEYQTLVKAGLGEEFVSSLAVGMDGTCNGLQHYSAMLLDPVGARAVNLTPSERPQDIYQNVMDSGLKRLEMDVTDEKVGHVARMWLKTGWCDRKLAKSPVMTFAYGSKQFGFRGQLIEQVKGRSDYHEKKAIFDTAVFTPSAITAEEEEAAEQAIRLSLTDTAMPSESTRIAYDNAMSQEMDEVKNVLPSACSYMAKVMWDSLGDVVVAAQQAMSWMQKCARLVAKHGKCVEWRVPGTGYWVVQEYLKQKESTIHTTLAGKALQCAVYKDTALPDANKQGNAVAPNVVHSLDAAALMMTVDLCATNGIECFHMVHDSYGVLAGDAELMAQLLRRAFITLYSSNDVVQSLYQQWLALLPDDVKDELPLPPEKGNLDLQDVAQSLYFFC